MPLSIRAITRIQDGDDAPMLGAGQDGYALTWDNGTSAFVATDTATFVGAADTQVIFNNGGSAAGHVNLTWDTANNNKLTVNGQSVYVPGGDFIGTMFVGDGGGSLVYTAGNDGRYNTAIGIGAMYSAVSTSYSFAEGFNAGRLNTSGTGWLAQGYAAGYSNTSGSYWIAQGTTAGYSNTSGSYWIAQGTTAGYSNTSGTGWIAQGYAAGYSNTSGSYWVAQGYAAGYSNTSGSYWVAQGTNALYNALGDGDIGIGYQAGDNITTGEYNIVIGYDKDAPSATADYQLVIGDYIIGDGSSLVLQPRADSTTAIQLQDSGGTSVLNVDTTNSRIGVGTTAPTAYMDLAASTTSTASLRLRDGTAPTSPSDGEIWQDGSNIVVRIDGVSYTLDMTAV